MNTDWLRWIGVLLTISLAACSSGIKGGALPSVPATTPMRSAGGLAQVVLTIVIPKHGQRAAFSPSYVSVATKSLTITASTKGIPAQTFGVNLTPKSNKNCKSTAAAVTCTQTLSLPPAKYTASFATYSGSIKKGKPTGKVLSARQQLKVKVPSKGLKLTIDDRLDGIPASVTFVPAADSTLSGSQSAGYTLSRCATAQQVDVIGVDAAGYYILGKGAPTPALSSSDSTHLAVAASTTSANAFTLTPSTPSTGSTVVLSASVKPPGASGAKIVSASVDVTFGGSICGTIAEYPLPNAYSGPSGITAGPDNNVWFTEPYSNRVGKITTAGTITEFSTAGGTVPIDPDDIVTGPDGNLWFGGVQGIGRMTTAGTLTQYRNADMQAYDVIAGGIAVGPDHNLWFTNCNAYNDSAFGIGKITTDGAIAEFPTPIGINEPHGIAAGSDGNLWFADPSGVDRITTAGTVTQFPGSAYWITAGPDGNLWFTDTSNSAIGRITTAGTIAEFTSGLDAGGAPVKITAGPDGNLWFTDDGANAIGRITTDGTITEYPIPTPQSQPEGIVAGADGSIWFTEYNGNNIGRLQ